MTDLHRDGALVPLYFGAPYLSFKTIFLPPHGKSGHKREQLRAKYGAFQKSRAPQALA